MIRSTTLRGATACLAAALFCATAHAQLFRSYLSSTGNDANPCTVQAPCRLLPAALAAVKDGGEVWMMDSANFNTAPVVIDKSVSILAIPGALGSIVGSGGDAIQIETPNVRVSLRNLKILNFNDGGNGINMTDGASLKVEGCEIAGFSSDNMSGIRIATAANATIVDTIVRDNHAGIWFSNDAKGDVARTTVIGNDWVGIFANATSNSTVNVTITESVSSNNLVGFAASTGGAGNVALMTVSRSTASNNGQEGFGVGGVGAILTVSRSVASNNFVGFGAYGGATFRSLSDNTVFDNTTDTSGTITVVAPK